MKQSLGRRLLVYFTLLMMLPLATTGWILYSVSDARMSQSALKLSSEIMNNVSMDLGQQLGDVDNLISLIVSDGTLQEYIKEQDEGGDQEELKLKLNQRMKRLGSYYDNVNGVYVLLDNGTLAKSRYYEEKPQANISKELYETARNRAGIKWVVSSEGSMVVDNRGDAVLCGLSSFTDSQTGQPCGVVIVELRLSLIRRMMQVDMGENSNVFFMGSGGDILVELEESEEQRLLAADLMKTEVMNNQLKVYDRESFFILSRRFSVDGCAIVGFVYKDFIRQDSKKILDTVLLVAAVAFVLNIIVSRFLKYYELRPIEAMMKYVQRIEQGDFSVEMQITRMDEMGQLATSMDHMTKHIQTLLERVQQEQERLRWAEFKALQAQINPHFLYNTLDSIKWLVRTWEHQKADEMIAALTDFFRRVLSQGKDFISIEDEVNHVESYLKIQKIRYHKIFDYAIYVEEGLESCIIPKLLLQPIVENALYHGIKPKGENGRLSVYIVSVEQDLVLEVRDNGVGIPKERQEELFQSSESYGMGNVKDRIHILAGNEYGIQVISDVGIGTSVSIRLPKTLGGELDHV